MGYSLKESHVHDYRDELEAIAIGVEEGQAVRFEIPAIDLGAAHYSLRQALKCAEVFDSLYEGRYAHLADSVKIKLLSKEGALLVVPKGGAGRRATLPDERKAATELKESDSAMIIVEFWPSPSFDEPAFIDMARRLGWKIFLDAKMVDDSGKHMYPAERTDQMDKEKGRGFGAILPGG